MRTYELQPTDDNLLLALKRDVVSRNISLMRFVDQLDVLDAPYVISLNGQWGAGKTFFVKQCKMFFDAYNDTSLLSKEKRDAIKEVWKKHYKDRTLNPQVTVYYDAWENDNDEDPIVSLVYNVLVNVSNDYSFEKRKGCLDILSAIGECISGRALSLVREALKKDDPFKELKESRDLRDKVAEFFQTLLPEKGNRLIIFIDELDRCKPTYAVKLLERIKHYMNLPNVTFVLSINNVELQKTIRQYYGADFDACRYLNRFFDIQMELPMADKEKYIDAIYGSSLYVYDEIAKKAAIKFNLELREIAKYLKQLRVAAYRITHSSDSPMEFAFQDGATKEFSLVVLLPVMIGLNLHDSEKYKSFICGNEPNLLSDFFGDENDHSFYNKLLSSDETFGVIEGKKTVTVGEKMDQLYRLIFVEQYDQTRSLLLGSLQVEKGTKLFIINAAGLLSKYANYD